MDLTFSNNGFGGSGVGQLTSLQGDTNIATLRDAILAKADQGVGLVSITLTPPNQMTFILTDGSSQGPFTLPTATFSFQGTWAATTNYQFNDIVTANGSTYLVLLDHTSGGSFDPSATDGHGNDLYGLLLSNPASALPTGGTPGQSLTKSSGADFDMAWAFSTFTSLSDAPSSYTSQSLKNLRVNSGATALEFWTWTVNDQTSSYSLILSDADKVVRYNSSSAGNVTVPANSSIAFPLGTKIEVRQIGTGALTIVAGGGVTINAPHGKFLNRQHGAGLLHKTATDTWDFQILGVGPVADLPCIAQITSSTSLALDRANGEVQRISLTGTVTAFTVAGWPTSGICGKLALEIQNTGAFNISTWPSGTIWPAGVAPTITSGASKKDIIILMTFDGGTTIYGSIAGQDYH